MSYENTAMNQNIIIIQYCQHSTMFEILTLPGAKSILKSVQQKCIFTDIQCNKMQVQDLYFDAVLLNS